MAEHDHDFGEPTKGAVRMCNVADCTEWRVAERGRWREPSASEMIDIVDIMFYDLIVYDTMVMIHGRDHGPRRAAYVLGYGPPV